MIVLDTHIWVWWVDQNARLTQDRLSHINAHLGAGLGVSVISCWEAAKLVEVKRLVMACAVQDWIEQALAYPGIQLPLMSGFAITSMSRH